MRAILRAIIRFFFRGGVVVKTRVVSDEEYERYERITRF